MKSLLSVIVITLMVGWALGFFIYNLGAIIHILLIVAAAVVIFIIIKRKEV